MNDTRKLFVRRVTLTVVGLSIFIGCTGGTDSGIDNFVVAGKLYEPDGKTPAAGALVVARDKNTTASILAGTTGTSMEVYRTLTDVDGYFSIDTIKEGLYVIEGRDNNDNMVLYDSISILPSTASLRLADDTLKPAGQVSGVIRLAGEGNYLQVFILAFGVERFCQVSADGGFLFEGFAEGTYRLMVLSLEPGYQSFDTAGIVVASGETTLLDTITLDKSDLLPIPQNVVASYDTERLEVLLSWNATSRTVTKGYNIYRKSENGGFWAEEPFDGLRLNAEVVTGPEFIDCTIRYRYLVDNFNPYVRYYITMVDTSGMESMMSEGCPVTLLSNWDWVDSTMMDVPDGLSMTDIFIDSKNRIHLLGNVGDSEAEYYRFNSNGEKQIFWKMPDTFLRNCEVTIAGVGRDNHVRLLAREIRLTDTKDSSVIFPYYLYDINESGTSFSRITHDSLCWKVVSTGTMPSYDDVLDDYVIVEDSLFYCLHNRKLMVINLNNEQFRTLRIFDSTSYMRPVFARNNEDKLFICFKEVGHDRFVEVSPEGNELPAFAEITFEYAHGDLIGTRYEQNGMYSIYYEDNFFTGINGSLLSKNEMPIFSSHNCMYDIHDKYVLNDGTVIMLVKWEEYPWRRSQCSMKTIFIKFRYRN